MQIVGYINTNKLEAKNYLHVAVFEENCHLGLVLKVVVYSASVVTCARLRLAVFICPSELDSMQYRHGCV